MIKSVKNNITAKRKWYHLHANVSVQHLRERNSYKAKLTTPTKFVHRAKQNKVLHRFLHYYHHHLRQRCQSQKVNNVTVDNVVAVNVITAMMIMMVMRARKSSSAKKMTMMKAMKMKSLQKAMMTTTMLMMSNKLIKPIAFLKSIITPRLQKSVHTLILCCNNYYIFC